MLLSYLLDNLNFNINILIQTITSLKQLNISTLKISFLKITM